MTWRCWRHRNHLVQPPGGWRCNHLRCLLTAEHLARVRESAQ